MNAHAVATERRFTFRWTPVRLILLGMSLLAVAVIIYRLIFGLGASTNLSDEWPWGLWIGFDVLTGVALAGGGYGTCLIVYILKRNQFKPIATAAMTTSLIGYLLVMLALFLDIGRWYNFWRPFVFWGYHSVLFEVFWCVSLYTTVQLIEFGHVAMHRLPALNFLHKFYDKGLYVLFIIGIVLPTLHQSSLGSLFIITLGKMHELWWSMLLPLFFLISSFFVGPAMVMVENTLAGHRKQFPVMQSMLKISAGALLIYAVLKVIDLIYRGAWPQLFAGTYEANMYLLEFGLGVLVPLLIFAVPAWRQSRTGSILYAFLVVGGVIFNRMNVNFTALASSVGVPYYPSWMEWAVTLGIVAMGCLLYLFLVQNFDIVEHEEEHESVQHGKAVA